MSHILKNGVTIMLHLLSCLLLHAWSWCYQHHSQLTVPAVLCRGGGERREIDCPTEVCQCHPTAQADIRLVWDTQWEWGELPSGGRRTGAELCHGCAKQCSSGTSSHCIRIYTEHFFPFECTVFTHIRNHLISNDSKWWYPCCFKWG